MKSTINVLNLPFLNFLFIRKRIQNTPQGCHQLVVPTQKLLKWLNTCIIMARIGVKLDANKKNSVYKGNSLRTISWFRALNLQTLDKKEVIHLFLFLFTLQLLPVLHLTLCPKCLWVGSSSSLLLISKLIFFPLDFRYIRLLFVWHFVLIWKCFCILFYVQLDVGALYF